MSLSNWIRPRLRLWAIYNELGYIPWHEPRRSRDRKRNDMGAGEAIIPFLNDDAKRTFSHLLLRPGYMMRDYIFRGQHERYLAPFTALLVFYSVFTLIVAVVNPSSGRGPIGQETLDRIKNASVQVDSTQSNDVQSGQVVEAILKTVAETILITHLDQYPEAVDTPWKESLAAVEGDIRSKGVPLFLGNFLLIWLSLAILLRKYKLSFSGAAAASAYVLCQYCIFMYLALLLSLGDRTSLGTLLMGALLLVDYRQLLGISIRPAFWLTVKTGLWYLFLTIIFYSLLAAGLIAFALMR